MKNQFKLNEEHDSFQRASKALSKAVKRAGKDVGSLMKAYKETGTCDKETIDIVTKEIIREISKWA